MRIFGRSRFVDTGMMISIDRYNKPSIGRRNINPNVFEKSNSIELRDENS